MFAQPMILRRAISYLLAAFLLIVVLPSSAYSQERKTAYGILIDNTGSLRSQFDQVIRISKVIVEQTRQRGPVSLFVFKTQGNKNHPVAVIFSDIQWSQDKDLLDKYIDSLFVVPGQTALMDGINAMALQLNTKASLDKDVFGDKIVFLITDGEDRYSKIGEKSLIKELKASGIRVYAVGLVRELDNERGLPFSPMSSSRPIGQGSREKAVAFLEKITKETGGRAVFPNSKKPDVDKLSKELFTR